MRLNLIFIFVFVSFTAAALDEQECREILKAVPLQASGTALTFTRWALPEGLGFEKVLDALVMMLPAGRPILILDANPGPELWHGHNIVGPGVDREFPGRTYGDLHEAERNKLFTDFAARIKEINAADAKPVVLIDHHFRSPFLAGASTTPMVVDFVTWLQKHHYEQLDVLRVIHTSMVLRDHSDPDIVLANFALGLLDQPEELREWAPLIKRIALLNDHGYLETLPEPERLEVEVGFEMMVAFEKLIPARPNGFDHVLAELPAALRWLRAGLARVPAAHPAPAALFLSHPVAPEFEVLREAMRARITAKTETETRIKTLLREKTDVYHRGPVLALRFRNFDPSGLDVLQFLRANPRLVPEGARVVATIGDRPGELVQIKLRALDPNLSFDSLFNKVIARGFGGGGRAGAGSLYGSAGARKTHAQLLEDLDWLADQIE